MTEIFFYRVVSHDGQCLLFSGLTYRMNVDFYIYISMYTIVIVPSTRNRVGKTLKSNITYYYENLQLRIWLVFSVLQIGIHTLFFSVENVLVFPNNRLVRARGP